MARSLCVFGGGGSCLLVSFFKGMDFNNSAFDGLLFDGLFKPVNDSVFSGTLSGPNDSVFKGTLSEP